MAELEGIDYRRAELKDVEPLMRLHQKAAENVLDDPLLVDYRKLKEAIQSQATVWIVADRDGEVPAALSILLDRENRLAKINRFIVDPNWPQHEEVLKRALPLLIRYLGEKGIEVIYNTTRTLSLEQQELTLGMGFKILGIFPNAQGADPLKINGLTAYFADGVLENRRHHDFKLHPLVQPIYRLAQTQCTLPDLPPADVSGVPSDSFHALPKLEIIHASAFVAHRYGRLKERRSLNSAFYPFQQPNALITDPAQKIEMFVRVFPEMKFAAIIGERLDLPVNPAELYNEVSVMLNREGISFIEVINDAADPTGIEFITRACFIPCVYFPAFKDQGRERRDYVVFARSFERVLGAVPGLREVNRLYFEYLSEYYHLDEKIHFSRLRPH